MTKKLMTLTLLMICVGSWSVSNAQTNKNKKSRYYQNSSAEEDFNVQGFFVDEEKNEVEKKPVEDSYDVKVKRGKVDGKYQDEKRVIVKETAVEADIDETPVKRARRPHATAYPTTYGGRRTYNENRSGYDKYYDGTAPQAVPVQEPVATKPTPTRNTKPTGRKPKTEREIKMTSNEVEYKTTVVKKRYTNLDVLCDDLDLAKVQRPVFKGICTECSRDVDAIIVNKNMSSLEKNYNLKQCYMQRDKRLRETLEDGQYKKWLRIKDADEYLILTKDSELKDGVNH